MENYNEIYGAFANVYIQYEGTLEELGAKIQKELDLPSIRYENIEDEPYNLVGYAEVLGFEIQLESSTNAEKWSDYQYILEVTTTDSFKEIFDNRMFDISCWMARYISLVCDITTLAENTDDKNYGQSFYFNKITSKRESSFVENVK